MCVCECERGRKTARRGPLDLGGGNSRVGASRLRHLRALLASGPALASETLADSAVGETLCWFLSWCYGDRLCPGTRRVDAKPLQSNQENNETGGEWGPLEIQGVLTQSETESSAGITRAVCAGDPLLGSVCPGVGKGAEGDKREPRHPLLFQPWARRPAEPSPANNWRVPGAKWEQCPWRREGPWPRTFLGCLHRFSILLRSSRAEDPLRPPKVPKSCVGVGEGSRLGSRVGGGRRQAVPKFSFLQSEGVALVLLPVAISKLFLSWVGKRSHSNGIHAFGAGIEGTSEKPCQPDRPLGREQGGNRRPEPTDACQTTLHTRLCGDPLRPPGDLLRCRLPCSGAQPLQDTFLPGRTPKPWLCGLWKGVEIEGKWVRGTPWGPRERRVQCTRLAGEVLRAGYPEGRSTAEDLL